MGGEIILATVATVDGDVLTTRDVQIFQVLNQLMGYKPVRKATTDPIESLIEERLLLKEAKAFYGSQEVRESVGNVLDDVKKKLKDVKGWGELGVTSQELRSIVTDKLKARRLVRFKKDSSRLPVTESEVQAEYKQNRIFYGSRSFDEVKEEIRAQKFQENFTDRIESWFQVLFKKYRVQRLTSHSRQKDEKSGLREATGSGRQGN